MKWLRTVDDRLVAAIQESYLWVWDRTGVYVGSLMFAAYCGDHVFYGPLKLFNFFFLGVAGVWCAHRYLVQSKDLRWLNDLQRCWRDFALRRFLMIFSAVVLASDIIQANAWHFASNLMFLIFNYLGCVQIREREPKEFFASIKLAGAQT